VTAKKSISTASVVSPSKKKKRAEIHNKTSASSVNSSAINLSKKLNYQFSDLSLLSEAITHRSKQSKNNERLEFLGDSVLGYVISSELFRRFPDALEGVLTRGRAALVKGETLAEMALSLDLGDFLQLGPGELKSGGFRRKSILADAMEAIIGAIYLDGGLEAAREYVLSIYKNKLAILSLDKVSKDPKTQLQEKLQSVKKPLPEYEVVATSGSDHEQVFEVKCKVAGISRSVKGIGRSRRKAEQDAAKKMLKVIDAGQSGDS